MVKRTSLKLEQKIIALHQTGKYTEKQVGEKYGIPRQTVWAILQRHKRNIVSPNNQSDKTTVEITKIPATVDIIKILTKLNWNEVELQDIWDIMRQGLRKKFNIERIQVNGQMYHL